MKDTFNFWGHIASCVNKNKRNNDSNNCNTTSIKIWDNVSTKPIRTEDVDVVDFSDCSADSKTEMVGSFFKIRNWTKGTIALWLAGVFSICVSIFVILVKPYDLIFNYKLLFEEGGELFDIWREPPIDLFLRVYLFNVTNSEEFMSGIDDQIKYEEVGPYTYRELLAHENTTFNDNGTVTATPVHPLQWVPEMSNGLQENDTLILPNIALLSIAHVMRDASYFTRFGLNLLIRQTKTEPLVAMTAKEFMFGYRSTLMTMGNSLMPSWLYFDKLGLIDRMYDFEGDYETIFTGRDDISKAGLIDTYRGSVDLPQWPAGTHCSNVHGASDGSKFQSYINESENLLFFRKSLCRAGTLEFKNKTEMHGLETFIYKFPDNLFDNGHVIPENKCFCREGNCLPAGLLDVTDCYYGFPIALSYPHFYDADPTILEDKKGLYPDKEKHESYFYIEPQTGFPMKLAARIQINMALGNIETIANAEKFSNMVVPMLWFEIGLDQLSETLVNKCILYLIIGPIAEKIFLYGGFVCGILLFFLTVYRVMFSRKRQTPRLMRRCPPQRNREDYFTSNMEGKLESYLNVGGRDNLTNKEMEVYYSGLITPLNQELDV